MVQYALSISNTSIPLQITSLKYTRYLEPKANTFEIEFPDVHSYVPTLNAPVQIYRDGQLAFSGIVEKIDKEFGPDGEKLIVSGRDVAGYKATSTLFKKYLPLRPIILNAVSFSFSNSSLYATLFSSPTFIYANVTVKASTLPSSITISSVPSLNWQVKTVQTLSDNDGTQWEYASFYAFSNATNQVSVSISISGSIIDVVGTAIGIHGADPQFDILGTTFTQNLLTQSISPVAPIPLVLASAVTSSSVGLLPYNDNLQVDFISSKLQVALATNNTLNTPVSNVVVGFTGSLGTSPSFLELITLAPDRNQFYYPRDSESIGTALKLSNTKNDSNFFETFAFPSQSKIFITNDVIWTIYPHTYSGTIDYLSIIPTPTPSITKGILFQNPSPPDISFYTDGSISVYTDGTYAYFVGATLNPFNVFYQKFLPSSNGLMIPQNIGYSVSPTSLSGPAYNPQVILDSNGGLWISYTNSNNNSVNIVFSSSSDAFASNITQTYSSAFPQYCSLVQLDNGNIGIALVISTTNSYRTNPASVYFGGYNASTSSFISLVSSPLQMSRMDSLSLARTGVNQFSTMYTTTSGILTCFTFNLLSGTITTANVYNIPSSANPPVPSLQADNSNTLHAFWLNSFSSTLMYTFSSNLTTFSTRTYRLGSFPYTFNFSMPSGIADNITTGINSDTSYIVGAFATTDNSGSEYMFLHTITNVLKPVFDIGYIPKLATPYQIVNNTLALFQEQNLSQIFQDIINTANINIYSSSTLPINQQSYIMRFKVETVSKALQELQASSGWTIKFREDNSVVFMPQLSLSSQSITFTRGSNLIDVQFTSDIESLVNRVALVATGTGTTQKPIVLENVQSENTYGLRESVLMNYSSFDPSSTKSYGQQIMYDYSQPRQTIIAQVIDNYSGVAYTVGDSVILVDNITNISGSYTILQIDKEFSPDQGEKTQLNLGKIRYASSSYSYKPPSLREVFGDIHTLIKESSNYPQNNISPINVSLNDNLTSGASLSMNFTIDSSYVDIITGTPAISRATLTLVPQNYYNQSTGSYVLSQITSVNISIQTLNSSTITSYTGVSIPTVIDVTNAIKNVDFYTLSISPNYQSTINTQGRISALLTILAGLNGVSL